MQKKQCQKCNIGFTVDEQDMSFYEKIHVPAPTWCPSCRSQRRYSWRNERNLYKGTCAATGKSIFTMFAPESEYTYYEPEYWASDEWEALDYGRDYDFNRPLFEQFHELNKAVPQRALFWTQASRVIDSPFTNQISNLKNCYLLFNSDFNRDCFYGTENQESNNCFDCKMVEGCELCYECVNCQKCHKTAYSVDCNDCVDVWFSKNCAGCTNCFGCVNLRKQSYCIFNEQYTKEEYEEKIQEFRTGSHESVQELQKKFYEFEINFPVKYIHGYQNDNVTGDYIYNSKNVQDSYMIYGCRDCRYCWLLVVPEANDCYDYSEYGDGAELIYESLNCGDKIRDLKFCIHCTSGSESLEYSINCRGCTNCFGCSGLRKKEYCIFNKQYTKEEYEELVPKIKQHMDDMPYTDAAGRVYTYGEFFPGEIAMFGYNETTAHERYPLTKEETVANGWRWREPDASPHQPTVLAQDLPDDIADVDESILSEVIACAETGKAYRIIASELAFLKQMNIPLPRFHPETRFLKRFAKMNGMKSYQRTTNDGVDVVTHYAPDDPHKILSEEGYRQEVM